MNGAGTKRLAISEEMTSRLAKGRRDAQPLQQGSPRQHVPASCQCPGDQQCGQYADQAAFGPVGSVVGPHDGKETLPVILAVCHGALSFIMNACLSIGAPLSTHALIMNRPYAPAAIPAVIMVTKINHLLQTRIKQGVAGRSRRVMALPWRANQPNLALK